VSCGINPNKIRSHRLYADDGEQLRATRTMSFAVVGNSFGGALENGKDGEQQADISALLVEDLAQQLRHERLAFLVLMGDMVAASSTKEWRFFGQRMRNLLDGSGDPDSPRIRMPVLPVAGEREYRRDRFLKGMGAAFPGVGAEIGYNRVASWYAFDVQVGASTWRFVTLDTNKAALRARWKEQLYWIPRAVEGDDYDHLVVMMHHPLLTLAEGREVNAEGAPAELLEAVEDSIGLMKLRAVFVGDPATSEAYLVGGRYGTLHVAAGGGGAQADNLQRWGSGAKAGVEVIKLEPIFDLAMLRIFNERALDREFPELVIDAARAERSYEGFPGMFDARYFPLFGYWRITLKGDELQAVYRLYDEESGFSDVYQVNFAGDEGWRTGS